MTKEQPGEHEKRGVNEEVFPKGFDSSILGFFKPALQFLGAWQARNPVGTRVISAHPAAQAGDKPTVYSTEEAFLGREGSFHSASHSFYPKKIAANINTQL